MRDAFSRSEDFLDLEKGIDQITKEQTEIQTEKLGTLTQEELTTLQRLLEKMNSKTNTNN